MTKYTIEELKFAVENSFSLAAALRELGLVVAGSNYQTIKNNIELNNLDISHFTGQAHLKGKTHNWAKSLPLDEVLVENRFFNSNQLRKRLIKEGYFECKCSCCGNDKWLGQIIPLELDHINGIKSDNRLENIRIICPNCHALTPNYRGKNIKKEKIAKNVVPKERKKAKQNSCIVCGVEIVKKRKRCKNCHSKFILKIDWPLIEELEKMLEKFSYSSIGRQLGVSDSAVRKRAKKYGIDVKRIT